MLGALRMRVAGKVSVHLQRTVSREADAWVSKLICGGVDLWRRENFYRFDDTELGFSVRLFYFCDRLIHENQQDWPAIHIAYDAVQPSSEMFLGRASPAVAPRPDFTILFGLHRIRVEAKRLRDENGLTALYVRRGMTRFIDGRYTSTPPHPGIMIGYVESGDVSAIVDRINAILTVEPGYGPPHVLCILGSGNRATDCVSLYESSHGDTLRLHHYEISFPGNSS